MLNESAHGGDLESAIERCRHPATSFLDASSSLSPWSPRPIFLHAPLALRVYPDRCQRRIKVSLSAIHGLDQSFFLAGNGASELFTWAARDASRVGLSTIPSPCFGDYVRAILCWDGSYSIHPLPLSWLPHAPQPYPSIPPGDVLWLSNPHNPTGQLWSRASLTRLLDQYKLVICDEAFLPMVEGGEEQSLIPLVETHPNLIVIRSLTKLYGMAGVRLGYAVAFPDRLSRWSGLRDPWPVNGLALHLADRLISRPERYHAWCHKVQKWTTKEGAWLAASLSTIPGIKPMPSAANFVLIRGIFSLIPLLHSLERVHRILLRDCRSFDQLGENWLRIGYQNRRGNRRIIRAIRMELRPQLPISF